jgi:diguanylate cyclase (GGDEF)-like protein
MDLGVRSRILTWLVLVVLPSAAVGWFTLGLVDARLSQRIESDLAVLRRLEGARVEDGLARYVEDGRRLASNPAIIDMIGAFDTDSTEADGADADVAAEVLQRADEMGSHVVAVEVVARGGVGLGRTDDYGWEPFDPGIVDRVLATGTTEFGNAFRSESGQGRLGLVVPVQRADGVVIGVLSLETDLAPILTLITGDQRFGATSEAHIAQATPSGDAQFITALRFERDAAFNKLVPTDMGLPITEALQSPDGRVMRAADYRGVDSILAVETIEATGWGLVLKIDAAEAYAPVGEIRRAIALGATLTVLLILGCTGLLINPLGRRLRRLSSAAGRVADGHYQDSIGDEVDDELGKLARSIDRLAADLEADIRKRSLVERQLRHQVSHDALTGIYNRDHANTQIELLSERATEPWAILFLDLDGFKPINDTHGHAVGDEILQAVAHRLAAAATGSMLAARWGGDEFVVVLPNTDGELAELRADEVRELFTHPVSTSIGELAIRCSIGIAVADRVGGDRPGPSVDAMVIEADAAMFAEKPVSRRKRRTWSKTERDVAAALREDRIEVWYQPVLNVAGNNSDVVGAEALVRLRATDGQLLPPGEFLPSVIDRSIGVDLDQHVASQAAQVTAAWLDRSLITAEFRMSVNLGAGSLGAEDLVQRLKNVLVASGLLPPMLVVEVSEAAQHINIDSLRALGALGIGSAIDDVGISHSNFDRLLQVRPFFAKLDRRWLATSPEETLILQSLVDTCRGLGLKMVAEGIETPEQHELARSLDIDFVQGFLFGRPVTHTDFERHWLRAETAVQS